MKEISEREARRLVIGGEAGYWSIHQRSVPIPHAFQYVLRLQGKCWLVQASEGFSLEYVGYMGYVGGKHKGAFAVNCDNPEITRMAQEEMKEKGIQLAPQ